MINMKISIKSKQIFEEHFDQVEEQKEAKLTCFDKGFEIIYDNTKVKFQDNVLWVDTVDLSLKIEEQKENVASMKTPYGIIDINVIGEYIKWINEPFSLNIKYKLKLGGSAEYINELQILVIEE